MHTIKIPNVPDALYELLEAEADRNHRTVSEEAVEWLRKGLALDAVGTESRVSPSVPKAATTEFPSDD